MLDFTITEWIIAGLCGATVGFAKTGIPGSGILLPVLAALIIPARESTGFLLPMLVMGDIMAIAYWRRHVDWKKLIRLLPWAWAGVVTGFWGMNLISNNQLKIFIGVTVILLMGLSWVRNHYFSDDRVPNHLLFVAFMGVLAGATSMMANAAGPVMVIYLMAMKLSKEDFIGTSAWFFGIINLSKLPFSLGLDLIDTASFTTNIILLPTIAIGGIIGIYTVHRVTQKGFNRVVIILALLAALYLIVGQIVM
ncbi:MAG: sulfite exporter TauE/SafE family protein [Deltaproteobacteria bacterium]|nr:sulfite exporter TauE/SafE family protein [Deltaproteobacteria bacterium]